MPLSVPLARRNTAALREKEEERKREEEMWEGITITFGSVVVHQRVASAGGIADALTAAAEWNRCLFTRS